MSEPANREFGQRARALRTHRNLSLSELQRVTGLHFSYLSSVERGQRNPTLNSMLLIAHGLGVDLCQLVRNLPRPDPPVKRPRGPIREPVEPRRSHAAPPDT